MLQQLTEELGLGQFLFFLGLGLFLFFLFLNLW